MLSSIVNYKLIYNINYVLQKYVKTNTIIFIKLFIKKIIFINLYCKILI